MAPNMGSSKFPQIISNTPQLGTFTISLSSQLPSAAVDLRALFAFSLRIDELLGSGGLADFIIPFMLNFNQHAFVFCNNNPTEPRLQIQRASMGVSCSTLSNCLDSTFEQTAGDINCCLLLISFLLFFFIVYWLLFFCFISNVIITFAKITNDILKNICYGIKFLSVFPVTPLSCPFTD